MIPIWTGEVKGMMHINEITNDDVACHMGVTRAYVSMLLNGKKTPKDAEDRVKKAIEEIILLRAKQ